MKDPESYEPYERRRRVSPWALLTGALGLALVAWLAWTLAGLPPEGGATAEAGPQGTLCGGWPEAMAADPAALQPYVGEAWLALRGGQNLDALTLASRLEVGVSRRALEQRAWSGLARELAAARDLALALQQSYLDARLGDPALTSEYRAVLATLRASVALQQGEDVWGAEGDIRDWLTVGDGGALSPLARALRGILGEALDPAYEARTGAALRFVRHLPALAEALSGQGDCPYPLPGVGGARLAQLSALLTRPEMAGAPGTWLPELSPFRPDLSIGECRVEGGMAIGIFEPWIYTALSALALREALSRDLSDGQSAFVTVELLQSFAPERAADRACSLLKGWPPAPPAGISPYLVHGDWTGPDRQAVFLGALCEGAAIAAPCPTDLTASRAQNAQVQEARRACYRRIWEGDPEAGRFLEQWRAYGGPARRGLLGSVLGGGCIPEVTSDTYLAWRVEVDGASRWEDTASNLSLLSGLDPRDFREIAPKELARLARAQPIYVPLREILRRQGATEVLGGGAERSNSGGTSDLPTITTSGG